jgi:hypothetical protein
MVFKVTPAAAAAMLALVTTMGHAEDTIDTIDRYVTFSGFGTLGVVHSDYSQGDFIANVVQPRGVGFRSWSASPDSDLGGQAKFTLTDSLSGVIQILSREDANGQWKPTVEWANLQYQIAADLNVRVGRMSTPTLSTWATLYPGCEYPLKSPTRTLVFTAMGWTCSTA